MRRTERAARELSENVGRLDAGQRFDIAAWRARRTISHTQAAALIGCGRSALFDYELGRRDVPRHIALACIALDCNTTMTEKTNG